MQAATHKLIALSIVTTFLCVGSAALAQSFSRVSGFDTNLPPSDPMFVEYDPTEGHYQLQVDLIFDPSAPPMEKHFQSPFGAAGPILLDALQPFPQPLWEDFLIVPSSAHPNFPVSDWHEEILTPGWEWVLPDDPRLGDTIPNPFLPNESLITKDGFPWPWQHIPMPNPDPSKLWVEFPPIFPGEVLDVHKALLWVGTPGNRGWGDNMDDAGNIVDESFIRVIEYPTPEPATLALLGLGGLVALGRRHDPASQKADAME